MILLEKNSGLLIQELRNGFGGHEIIYFLFNGDRLIATSLDRMNWRMSSWNNDKSLISVPQKIQSIP